MKKNVKIMRMKGLENLPITKQECAERTSEYHTRMSSSTLKPYPPPARDWREQTTHAAVASTLAHPKHPHPENIDQDQLGVFFGLFPPLSPTHLYYMQDKNQRDIQISIVT